MTPPAVVGVTPAKRWTSTLGDAWRPAVERAATSATARVLARPAVVPAVLFVLYCAVSFPRQWAMQTGGYDLGIFEQAIAGWAHGGLPYSAIKGYGFDLLGDHFSPILVVAAPFYRLVPSPYTLLAVQAAVLALGALPVMRLARERLGDLASVAVGLVFGLAWPVLAAVTYDFHEVVFAVPLLAFSLTSLLRGRPTAAVLWALPLLLVKEDLGFTIAMIGVVLALRGWRRHGLVAVVAGVAGSVLTISVLLPWLSPFGSNVYVGKVAGSAGPVHLLATLAQTVADPQRLLTLTLLLLPTAFLALRSPVTLVALPTLLWRFSSDDSDYWGLVYHYNVVLVPVLACAFLDVLLRRSAEHGRAARSVTFPLLAATVVTAALALVVLPPVVRGYLGVDAARVASARQVLSVIPDGATVSASNRLAPQLADRTTVYLFGTDRFLPPDLPTYVAVDILDPRDPIAAFPVSVAQLQADYQLALRRYDVVAEDGWVVVLRLR